MRRTSGALHTPTALFYAAFGGNHVPHIASLPLLSPYSPTPMHSLVLTLVSSINPAPPGRFSYCCFTPSLSPHAGALQLILTHTASHRHHCSLKRRRGSESEGGAGRSDGRGHGDKEGRDDLLRVVATGVALRTVGGLQGAQHHRHP